MMIRISPYASGKTGRGSKPWKSRSYAPCQKEHWHNGESRSTRYSQTRTALTHHPDGLELEWLFSEETARCLLDFILFERACCQTFTY